MKTLKQLVRQPLKSLSGLLLMTLAAAILCVTVGQALAAKATEAALQERFSSVAIPLVKDPADADEALTNDSFLLEAELIAWAEQMAAEHPDVVKEFMRHGTLSAYIPELTPFNVTQEPCHVKKVYTNKYNDAYYREYQSTPLGMPYTGAMFVITLDEISEPKQIWDYWWTEILPVGYSVKLTGTVTQVVSIQESYRGPLGRTARVTLNVSTLEELEALNLTPGEQYLIYGTDYSDDQWALFGVLSKAGYAHLELDTFEPDKLKVFTEEEIQQNIDRGKGDYPASYDYIMLEAWQLEMLNAFSMTVAAPLALAQYQGIRDEEGYLQEVVEINEYTVKNANGETLVLNKEEYIQRYQIPTIAHLEGSLEDFLASEEGALWKAAIDNCAVNHHAFAVVGLDRLNYFANFSLDRAKISQGREFTAEELENGARVCLVHEWIAYNAGLQIGDTINLSFYATDPLLPSVTAEGPLNPMASYYFDTTPFTETAEYTIVGFYSGDNWPNVTDNPYGLSANTVFVPRNSVQTPMEKSNSIVLNSIALQNGKIEEFQELAQRAGYSGRFNCNDQNYSTIAANFHNYEELARQVLTIGAVIYGVLLFLFLLLYPGMQRNNVRTMQSIGSGFLRRFGYVLTMSMAIIIPAAALGALLGVMLWDRMVVTLQEAAMSAVALELDMAVLARIAGVQMLFALVLTIFVSLIVAAPRRMSDWR